MKKYHLRILSYQSLGYTQIIEAEYMSASTDGFYSFYNMEEQGISYIAHYPIQMTIVERIEQIKQNENEN